jgi:hypothetical protein
MADDAPPRFPMWISVSIMTATVKAFPGGGAGGLDGMWGNRVSDLGGCRWCRKMHGGVSMILMQSLITAEHARAVYVN